MTDPTPQTDRTDQDAPRWSRLVQRLAGEAPDELVRACRRHLADGNRGAVARQLVAAVRLGRVALLAPDRELVAGEVVRAGEAEPDWADSDVWEWRSVEGTHPEERAVVRAVGAVPGALALWAALRTPPVGVDWLSGTRVFVVQMAAGHDTGELMALEQRLSDTVPSAWVQVVALAGADPTPQQRAVCAAGAVLWSVEPEPEPELSSLDDVRPLEQVDTDVDTDVDTNVDSDVDSDIDPAVIAGDDVLIARVFDFVDPETGPGFADEHLVVEDPERRVHLLRRLAEAPVLVATNATMPDVLEPAGEVPMSIRSDGRWVWTDSVAYYLERHHVAPDEALLAHLATAPPAPTRLDDATLHRLLRALQPDPNESEPAS